MVNGSFSFVLTMLALAVAGPGGGPGPTAGATSTANAAGGVLAAVAVKVTNPMTTPRALETISLPLADLAGLAPTFDVAKIVVVDGGGKMLLSQLVDTDGDEKPDELVFQSGFGGGETKTFVVEPGVRHPPSREDFKVYGRFVRERHDDFAWENDRIAHRMYGPDLENWKAEPLTSSGVDVWCKRVRRLVVNDWYMTDNYHQDNGDGADLYSVGKSRGCGGVAIWVGDRPFVSRNFTTTRVLANGPIRLIFELGYEPWDAGGRRVSETKRVTVDAGKSFDRFDSVFRVDGAPGPLAVGVGIAKHDGGMFDVDAKAGWLRSWEPLKKENGNLGCAVVTPRGSASGVQQTAADRFLMLDGRPGAPVTYYAGFGWDRSGDVADRAAWGKQVETFAREVASPLRVSLAATKVASLVPGTDGGSADVAKVAKGVGAGVGVGAGLGAGADAWAARTCDAVMARSPVLTEKWTYDAGLVLRGCWQAGLATKDRRTGDYVKATIDRLVDADGHIKGYRPEDYNLDNINMGKLLFPLYRDATDAKDKDRYRKALASLRAQMQTQPRTSDGAFWHKGIYPSQMWLDGVYMASPFLAEYGVELHEPALIDEAVRQIRLAETHMRDPKTGLLYHGWNETKAERWADPRTGTSSQFWGRAMGWYAMAVVDVLDQMPRNHPERAAVLGVLRRLVTAIASVQDKTSGVWWQVLNAPGRTGNFEEASASAMFVYAVAKAVKNGWIDARVFGPVAARGYRGVVSRFVEDDGHGQINVKSICKVAGLGGNPYRDGSFAYYTSTEVGVNDPKGVGAFILASVASEGS